MPGWELHDGAKILGPMSEDAVLWAIKQGLPSATRVRAEGQEAWIALDDHQPFADELIARDAGRKRKRRGKRLGYTWQEIVGVALALASVALLVFSFEWLADHGKGLFHSLASRVRGPGVGAQLGAEQAAPPDPSATKPAPDTNVTSYSPVERAKMATAALDAPNAEPRAAVCKARLLLESIPEADRKKPDIQKALSHLSSKELPLLRAEQIEFEKTRGVICGDGTKPKDCPCQGAHESCCVHHKGVLRCEPLPAHIRCP